MLRVGQTAEKESWRYRGDRQTARVRKAGGKTSRLKYRRRKAGGQSDFRGEMLAASQNSGSGCRRLTAASGK